MKIRHELVAVAAVAFAVGAAQAHDSAKREYRSYNNNSSPNAIHTGGMTAEDQALADKVADALRADPRMNGATVTVSARNGLVTLSGLAPNPGQSDIAQRDAKDVAGARVIGFLSPGAG
jgi:osmotically-inducible protein OsmY